MKLGKIVFLQIIATLIILLITYYFAGQNYNIISWIGGVISGGTSCIIAYIIGDDGK